MALHVPPVIKKHPIATAAIGVAIFVLVYYLASSGSSSSGVSVGSSGPSAADVALQEQQNAIEGTLSLDSQQAGEAFAAQQLNAQTSTAQQVNAITGQQNLALIQASTDQLNISSQTKVAEDQISAGVATTEFNDTTQLQAEAIAQNAAVNIAQFETQANVATAQINANAQTTIASYEAATVLGEAQDQAQATESLANAQFKIAEAGAGSSAIGSIASVAALALL